MPVRGLGWKKVLFGGMRCLSSATRSILATGTGLRRNAASALLVLHFCNRKD